MLRGVVAPPRRRPRELEGAHHRRGRQVVGAVAQLGERAPPQRERDVGDVQYQVQKNNPALVL